MLSKYVFRLSALKERHRISQVFILPPFQKSGHGKELIDTVYDISLRDPKCFEITTEIPSFEYQCLRDFKELEMVLKSQLLDVSQLKGICNSKDIEESRSTILGKDSVRSLKQQLKIPGHQIERLINVLIYYKILSQKEDMPRAHFEEDLRQMIIVNRSPFKTRRKMPHLTLYGKVTNLKEFMLEKVLCLLARPRRTCSATRRKCRRSCSRPSAVSAGSSTRPSRPSYCSDAQPELAVPTAITVTNVIKS